MFNSYADVLAHLNHLGLFHMDFSLDRMRGALSALSLSRPPFPVVQILGTNGKGSTSTFLSSIARAHGCSTGLYTSPHFVSPAERIRINGIPLAESRWAPLANQIFSVTGKLTYFEFLTMLALLAFRESGVQLAVTEAGLGGRHDATTAFAADMLCYTPVGMDHMEYLGNTLAEIAAEKSCAIRSAAPVFSARQEPEALAALTSASRKQRAPLTVVEPLLPGGFHPGLSGPHQRGNAALAVAAWRGLCPILGIVCNEQALRAGVESAFLPGRLQCVPAQEGLPPLVLDGAHNEHGMRALVRALSEGKIQPSAVIFSCLKDKNWHPMCELLLSAAGKAVPLYVPVIHNPRAEAPSAIAAFLRGLGAQRAEEAGDVAEALARVSGVPEDRPVLICGSLYLLSEFYYLFPRYLDPGVCRPASSAAV